MWENHKWVHISNIISWYAISTTIWVIIMISNLPISSSSSLTMINNVTHIGNNDPIYLDDYLFNYSATSLANKPDHTGVLYNITLPANFSSMKVSVLRLRSNTLWYKGANLSSFDIPPKIYTMPNVKRLAFMYENLGNLSSRYYELPGYLFLTKVIGFAVYNASNVSGGTSSITRLNITLLGDSIEVDFTHKEVLLSQGKNNDTDVKNEVKRCVRFDPLNGVVELTNMSRPNVCLAKGVGHFVIAMPKVNDSEIVSPSPSPSPSPSTLLSPPFLERQRETKRKTITLWVWWVIEFAGGLVGLVFLLMCFVVGYKTFVSRKLSKMERNSLESESLDTKWVGNSKFPLAPASRTQAVLENDLAPV